VQTLFAVLVFALLGLSGLAIDGGQVLVAKRDAQGLADAAARAGAAQLDEVAARANPEIPPHIDPAAATTAAIAYIDEVRPGATIQVLAVDATHIRVRVTSRPVPVSLLQLAGVGQTVRAEAIGEAEPQTGIAEPGQ
jgi:Flp pilus assembly protein TadG